MAKFQTTVFSFNLFQFVLLIQSINIDTRTYTPGYLLSAHSIPHETTPNKTGGTISLTIGPKM